MQNPSGTSFPLNGGALVIAEMQYTYPSLGTMLYADQAEPLARIYKLGFWYDTESFADQQFDNTGLSLANPASTGIPHAASRQLQHLRRRPIRWSGWTRTEADRDDQPVRPRRWARRRPTAT